MVSSIIRFQTANEQKAASKHTEQDASFKHYIFKLNSSLEEVADVKRSRTTNSIV